MALQREDTAYIGDGLGLVLIIIMVLHGTHDWVAQEVGW